MKTEVVAWKDFFAPKKEDEAAAVTLPMYAPAVFAVAAGQDTWTKLWTTAETFGDYICVGALMFTGGIWMFGHRSKALEMIIGIIVGYLIIIHAMDIQRWLKGM